MNKVTVLTRAELTEEGKGKTSKVIEYESGSRLEIPTNKDGSIKYFDDSKLVKNKNNNQ